VGLNFCHGFGIFRILHGPHSLMGLYMGLKFLQHIGMPSTKESFNSAKRTKESFNLA
jgi:hypothetical protein